MRGSRLIFNGVVFSSIELKSCICPPVRITPRNECGEQSIQFLNAFVSKAFLCSAGVLACELRHRPGAGASLPG